MPDAVVLHHYNGSTKVARLSAPAVSRQMVDGGIHVVLLEEQGGPVIGDAMFTRGGVVGLSGLAVEQYGPLAKPGSMSCTCTCHKDINEKRN